MLSRSARGLRSYVDATARCLVSLTFNLGGLVTGFIVSAYVAFLEGYPWALALYPGVLSVRGAVNGIFCGRLSTGLHIGVVRPSLRGNTHEFRMLLYSMLTLALLGGLLVGVTVSASYTAIAGGGLETVGLIVASSVITMALSFILVAPITVSVSITSYRLGLDPDYTTYPVMSTVADLLVTPCYVLVLHLLAGSGSAWPLVALPLALPPAALAVYVAARWGRDPEYSRTLREALPTVALVSLIVVATGSALYEIGKAVGRRREVYMVYPAILNTVGDTGSIVGSVATTRLALGLATPSLTILGECSAEILGAWTASLVIFTLYSTIACLTLGVPGRLLDTTMTLVLANLIAMPLVILISELVAIATFRVGLDPDNFVNPIESSLADAITTIALLAALTLT